MDFAGDLIEVEVAYATPERQLILKVGLPAGATAREAVERSGILDRFPEINLAQQKIGVFSKVVSPDAVLRPRDRVEIYRPLIADPKSARRERAKQASGRPSG